MISDITDLIRQPFYETVFLPACRIRQLAE